MHQTTGDRIEFVGFTPTQQRILHPKHVPHPFFQMNYIERKKEGTRALVVTPWPYPFGTAFSLVPPLRPLSQIRSNDPP